MRWATISGIGGQGLVKSPCVECSLKIRSFRMTSDDTFNALFDHLRDVYEAEGIGEEEAINLAESEANGIVERLSFLSS